VDISFLVVETRLVVRPTEPLERFESASKDTETAPNAAVVVDCLAMMRPYYAVVAMIAAARHVGSGL
jgi:hypothetical protein